MTADVGAELLAAEYPDLAGVVVARAGSPDPLVEAGTMTELAGREFGDPLHLLVIPGVSPARGRRTGRTGRGRPRCPRDRLTAVEDR